MVKMKSHLRQSDVTSSCPEITRDLTLKKVAEIGRIG